MTLKSADPLQPSRTSKWQTMFATLGLFIGFNDLWTQTVQIAQTWV